MKTKRYLIKQLTPAEVGDTGTHEKYIRCPNDFDYQSFFQQNATQNKTVLEILFKAIDLTSDSSYGITDNLRFVHFINNANKEKRIPSLKDIYDLHSVKAGDIVKLVSTTHEGKTTFSIKFCKATDAKLSDSCIFYEEKVSDDTREDASITEIVYNEYIKLLRENFNLVLTGAPGTGKTYMAKNLAALLIGNCSWDDLDDEQKTHAEFVQFHPSFDYTDFVEGLRPDKSGSFVRTDGVFKAFCKKALDCPSGKWPTKIIKGDTTFETIYQTMVDDVKNRQIVAYTRRSGTQGELHVDESGRIRYYMAQVKPQSEENMKLLYDYFRKEGETDVQNKPEAYYFGLISTLTADRDKPTKTIDYVEYSWMLQQLLNRAALAEGDGLEVNDYERPYSAANSPYVFIIDEINRGEISKIFGELFYSIEPDYRGEKTRVRTQYNNMVEEDDVFRNGFFVPENVYIIGTMNDIDRGVEAMDFAIRRRFAWREVTAKESADNMGLSDLAKKKMTALNEALKSKGLNQAYYIGGAYFRKLKGADFDSLWKYHLKGIVSEYFRGEPEADKKVEEVGEAYTAATIEVSAEQPTLNPSTEQQSE